MEFLKAILGEELFNQVSSKINEHNGNEANKDKQLKLANLASGEYVGKGKHDALQALLDGQKTELEQAKGLIEELKKGTKGNEELQGKITAYEGQVAELQQQLADTKMKAAIKVALLSEKAVDVDYLTFKLNEKLKEKGEALELDENENIKGWDEQLTGLKTQFPTMFSTSGNGGDYTPLDNDGLPKGGDTQSISKEEFAKMGYKSRVELKNSNPELYAKLAN